MERHNSRLNFTILFLLMIILYWPIFSAGPFWDDKVFLFNSPLIQSVKNPIDFWLLTSDHTKAWPLGFTFFWVMHNLFSSPIIAYRVLALGLHFTNGFLIYKILKPRASYWSWIAVVFFLFHPMQVETLSWTIQILSIFSTTLALASLNFYFNSKPGSPKITTLKTSVLLILSLAIKPWAVLYSLIGLLDFKAKNMLGKIVQFAVIGSVGLYFIYRSQVGVEVRASENQIKNTFMLDLEQNFEVKEKLFNKPELNYLVMTQSASNILDITPLESLVLRLSLVGNSFYFYFSKTFFPQDQTLIYPKKIEIDFTTIFGLGLLVALTLFSGLWLFNRAERVPFWGFGIGSFLLLVSFLPVSGLIYIPQMKYGTFSDHWYYLQAVGYGTLLTFAFKTAGENVKYTRKVIALAGILLFILSIKSFQYARIFNNRAEMLQNNMKVNPKASIVRDLLKYEKTGF